MDYIPCKLDVAKTEAWIDDLGYHDVRSGDCVQRLKKVCVLGTMQYVVDLKHNYSRYEHSLGVAKLAFEYACHWGLSEDARRHVVLVALLHDIGHLPFSHASEVFFRGVWGRYHSGHGARLIRHLIKALELRGASRAAGEVARASKFVIDHHNTRGTPIEPALAREEYLMREIFHGVLSADTLDGITRAAESTGLSLPQPFELIRSTYPEGKDILISADARQLVERFFELKHRIYHDFIYCSRGLAAEAMLTRALGIAFADVSDANDFLSLDDDDAMERLHSSKDSARIVNQLASRNLYCSLLDVNSDKYALVTDVYERLSKGSKRTIPLRQELEKRFAKQMQIADPNWFIIHPIIKLNFDRRDTTQKYLPHMPCRLGAIAGTFATIKSFGDTIGVVFPAEYASSTRLLTVPNTKLVVKRIAKKSSESKPDHVAKHSGAFMTPPAVAKFMAQWAIDNKNHRVLDPASGKGVFLQAAYWRLRELGSSARKATQSVFGIEADSGCCADSLHDWPEESRPIKPQVLNRDFLAVVKDGHEDNSGFDVIIGNPPYIRARWLAEKTADLGISLARRAHVDLPRTAGSWAAYLVCAAMLLKPKGRLAMVLPAELLSTAYAQPVREYLERLFKSMVFVLFEKAVFGSVQQDVVVLLASNDPPFGIRRCEVRDHKELTPSVIEKSTPVPSTSDWLSGKWTHVLTNPGIIDLLGHLLKSGRVCQSDCILSTRLGQVTGDNKFFLLDTDTVRKYGISEEWLMPMVSKASEIPGVVLTRTDIEAHKARGNRCLALVIPSTANISRDKNLVRYLEQGKRDGVDTTYKCRTRWPWYSIPMQLTPDALLTYMSGERVRLVLNSANVNSTNTIHNVIFDSRLSKTKRKAIISAFHCSLTALSTELVGRSYGGGVLKLELNEARRVLLPEMNAMPDDVVDKLARMLHSLDSAIRQNEGDACGALDDLVMREGMGLCKKDIQAIIEERIRLTTRRMTRLH